MKMMSRLVLTLVWTGNRKVFSIACHNVSIVSNEDPFKDITGYINAYDPELCENYVSDSCRAWYLEDLSRLLNFNYKKVQLLIHPFLWTEDVCKRDAVLERLFREIEKKKQGLQVKMAGGLAQKPKSEGLR